MKEPHKIRLTPLTFFDLKLWQKSLLGNIATKTDLKKEDVLDKVIGAGLHAIMNNDWTFRLPLAFRVEDGFQKPKKKRRNQIGGGERKVLKEEHLRSCFTGENSFSKSALAKKLKEITGAGESTCYRAISKTDYLGKFLTGSERGKLKLIVQS